MTAQATVYTNPGCRSCKRVVEKLEQAGISVEVVDLSLPEFSDARTFVTQTLGLTSVPVIAYEREGQPEYLVGYDPTALKALISSLKLDIVRRTEDV